MASRNVPSPLLIKRRLWPMLPKPKVGESILVDVSCGHPGAEVVIVRSCIFGDRRETSTEVSHERLDRVQRSVGGSPEPWAK